IPYASVLSVSACVGFWPVHTVIYTLSLHDALPILPGPIPMVTTPGTTTSPLCIGVGGHRGHPLSVPLSQGFQEGEPSANSFSVRSEEHTSELQSRENLVCRLLLEKKNNKTIS